MSVSSRVQKLEMITRNRRNTGRRRGLSADVELEIRCLAAASPTWQHLAAHLEKLEQGGDAQDGQSQSERDVGAVRAAFARAVFDERDVAPACHFDGTELEGGLRK